MLDVTASGNCNAFHFFRLNWCLVIYRHWSSLLLDFVRGGDFQEIRLEVLHTRGCKSARMLPLRLEFENSPSSLIVTARF